MITGECLDMLFANSGLCDCGYSISMQLNLISELHPNIGSSVPIQCIDNACESAVSVSRACDAKFSRTEDVCDFICYTVDLDCIDPGYLLFG